MKIIFIYNAPSGIVSAVRDSFQKLVAPSSYGCELCSLTHGLIQERRVWKDFRKSLPHETVFLHSDEIPLDATDFLKDQKLPVVYTKDEDDALRILLTKDDFKKAQTLPLLQEMILGRLGG